MIKELLNKKTMGMLGISLTGVIAIITYQILTGLFIEAVVNAVKTMPH